MERTELWQKTWSTGGTNRIVGSTLGTNRIVAENPLSLPPFLHEPHMDLPEIEICLSLLSMPTFAFVSFPYVLGQAQS